MAKAKTAPNQSLKPTAQPPASSSCLARGFMGRKENDCPSPPQMPASSAQRTPWHLEGQTAKAYRVNRGIQLI
jgi:hypothetical protein